MFHIRGPLPDTSPLFVGRQAELARIDEWIDHGQCVGAVLGGRQNGKTSLLLRLRKRHEQRCGFALIDFQAIAGGSPDECAQYIARCVIKQLHDILPAAGIKLPEGARDLAAFFEHLARRVVVPRLIVAFDELGALPEATRRRLGSTIRAHFTGGALDATLRRLLFVLAGGREMLTLSVAENSPLRNVTDGLYLGDLSLADTQELLQRGGAERLVSQAQAIHRFSGGHPYWTQLLAMSVSDDHSVDEAVRELLQIEAANLPHLMSSLAADGALQVLASRIAGGERVGFSRANPHIAQLELLGLVKNRSGVCAMRNPIYLEAVRNVLAANEPAPADEVPRTQPLSILFVAANPVRSGRLALGEEARAIETRMHAAQRRNAITLTTCWAARPDDLQQALLEHEPTVVHFSGHGEGGAGIVLHGERDDEERYVSGPALRHLFTIMKERVRVVVLNACFSEQQACAIVEVIDCVVGMRGAVNDISARVFAAAFYRGLAYGRSVQQSFDLGINALMLESLPHENIPVLLTREGVVADAVFTGSSF